MNIVYPTLVDPKTLAAPKEISSTVRFLLPKAPVVPMFLAKGFMQSGVRLRRTRPRKRLLDQGCMKTAWFFSCRFCQTLIYRAISHDLLTIMTIISSVERKKLIFCRRFDVEKIVIK